MKKYEELAKDIINHVGGEGNVISLSHCITRLRFKLKDEAKADTDYLKNHEQIVTVIKSGGQYQVVIGNAVADVYDTILEVSGIKGAAASAEPAEDEEKELSPLDRFIDLISGIFTPVLSVLIATGMVKGFLALFTAIGLLDAQGGTASILQVIGDVFFYFLPIFLGLTAARKFKMNEFTGMAIGASLVYPTILSMMKAPALYTLFQGTVFQSDVHLEFLGIPVILMNYTSSVIPVVVAVYFASKVERIIANCMPSMLKNFMTPFFTLLIVVPLTLLLIGPAATWLGQMVGAAALAVYNLSPVVSGLLIGTFWQVFVMFGLHWGLVPIMINNITVYGYDPLIITYFGASFAQIGVVLAIILKTKDKKLRSIGVPAFFSGIFGVTEPCIYGVTLPRKKYFLISCIGGGVGGAAMTALSVRLYTYGSLGIFGYPPFINLQTGDMSGMYGGMIASALAFATGFLITFSMYRDKEGSKEQKAAETAPAKAETIETVEENKENGKGEVLAAPLTGQVVPLSEVPDEAFAAGILGKGLAINPTEGLVKAPADATVATLFPTGHAVGLITDKGVEMLIHIGMDTVQMEGRGFEALVKQGDKVKKGQPLIRFDIEKIKQEGHPVITPVLVTNPTNYTDIVPTVKEQIQAGENLLSVIA